MNLCSGDPHIVR